MVGMAHSGWTRRDFLRTATGTVAVWWAGGLRGGEAPARGPVVSILHTTDLHGHVRPGPNQAGAPDLGGLARCADQIARWREENPRHLLVDGGDVFQGTPYGQADGGGLLFDLLGRQRYDAWVIGNHEFDFGTDLLAERVARCAVPALAANLVVDRDLARRLRVRPWLVREVDGIRIGIVGLTTPGIPFWLPPEYLGGVEVTDPVPALGQAMGELEKQGVDAVVVVAHMGWRREGDDFANLIHTVAGAQPRVALIVGAHTHRNHPMVQVVDVPYTQADHWGAHAGRADLVFDAAARRVVAVEARTVRMDRLVDEDPAVMEVAGPALAAADASLARPLARLSVPLAGNSQRGRPADTDRLVAVALREALAVDGTAVGAVLGGPFRAEGLGAGTVTWADLWTMLPYENVVVTGSVAASELAGILREAEGAGSTGGGPRTLVGLEPVRDADGAVAGFARPGGGVLPADEPVVLAVNSYDAASAGRRLLLLRALLDRPSSGRRFHDRLRVREAVAAWLERRGELAGVPAWEAS